MVTRRIFEFDPPDRFVAGAVGQPGQRAFYLQARKGGALVSLGLEKTQVAALAERLVALVEELRRRGVEIPDAGPPKDEQIVQLDEPVSEQFRVGAMALGWDGERRKVVVEAQAAGEDEEAVEIVSDDEAGPDLVRVHIPATEALVFAARAARVVAAGRPPCPLCGQPLDPQGHICPRRNGYLH